MKISKRQLVLLVLQVLLVIFLFRSALYKSYIQENQSRQILCVTSLISLPSPAADGVIMKPNLPPVKWPFYHDGPLQDDRRIFFHETSGKGELSFKQCCAIESAAIYNTDRPVQVFLRPTPNCSLNSAKSSSFPLMYDPPWLKILSHYHNVEVILINEEYYFSGTQLEKWYHKGEWRKSKFEKAHLSDYIRILTQLKGGGLYLDIDIVTLKPFKRKLLRNFLVYANGEIEITNAAMHIERGHWMPREILKLIADDYDPKEYLYHGPEAIREVMINMCGLIEGIYNSNQCSDIKILPSHFFYPIPNIFSNTLFLDEGNKTNARILSQINKSFGLHLANSLSHFHEPLNINSNQKFAIIARKVCPLTVASAKFFQYF